MSEAVSLVILTAVLGTFGLLERRMDRLETALRQEISEVRADIVRHLEWHIQGR